MCKAACNAVKQCAGAGGSDTEKAEYWLAVYDTPEACDFVRLLVGEDALRVQTAVAMLDF